MSGVSEPLIRSKMAITLELKVCLSNFSKGVERQEAGYQDTGVTFVFTRPVNLSLISYF